MATGAAIVSTIGTIAGIQSDLESTKNATKLAEDSKKFKADAIKKEKVALLGTKAQSQLATTKAEEAQRKVKAEETAKIAERKQRKGQKTLLTGSEAGFNQQTIS